MNHCSMYRVHVKQGGYLLMTMGLTLLIMSLVAMQQLREEYDNVLNLKAVAQATALNTVRNAADDYSASYYGLILAMPTQGTLTTPGSSITIPTGTGNVNVADGNHPTVAELVALGKLPPNYSSTAIFGGNYKIALAKTPAGCAAPNCNIEGYVAIDSPIQDRGATSVPLAGVIAQNIGGNGGYSKLESPAIIKGIGAQWSVANFITSQPAGIVAARFGYASSVNSAFVRKDGSVWMENNFNMGGHSIDNAVDFNGTGKINGSMFVSSGQTLNGACTDTGAIARSGTTQLFCDGSTWKAVATFAAPSSACATAGLSAFSTSTGEQMLCRNGVYVRLAAITAKQTETVVQDGSAVPIPICDTGLTPNYRLVVNNSMTDFTVAPPYQGSDGSVTTTGGNYVVKIVLRRQSGGTTSANAYSLSGLLYTFCE